MNTDITLHVWRGIGIPDNRDGQPKGQWDTLTYPAERRDSAERAYHGFIRQGFHVDMIRGRSND